MILTEAIFEAIVEDKNLSVIWTSKDEVLHVNVSKNSSDYTITIWSLGRWSRTWTYNVKNGFTNQLEACTKSSVINTIDQIEYLYSNEDLMRQFD